MMAHINSFINMLFISIIALFPVINPIGSALIVNPYLSGISNKEKKAAVKKITTYTFLLCIIFLFGGHWILEVFGITIPVIQVAGGIMICKIGWDTLSTDNSNSTAKGDSAHLKDGNSDKQINDKLFYPLTFPITTGGGTISVLFTLSAHSADSNWQTYLINTTAVLIAIITMCMLVYIFYGNTRRIVARLGVNGQIVMSRIIAFLIFCVGLQIAFTGIKILF